MIDYRTFKLDGQLVEILNIRQRQVDDIESQTCKSGFDPRLLIGQRFFVERVYYPHALSGVIRDEEVYVILHGFRNNFGGHLSDVFYLWQFKLILPK